MDLLTPEAVANGFTAYWLGDQQAFRGATVIGDHDGFVGAGIPTAPGMSITHRVPVPWLLGDQGFTNGSQGLVAAQEGATVLYLVCNNGESVSLREQGVELSPVLRPGDFDRLLMNPPGYSYVTTALAAGVPAVSVAFFPGLRAPGCSRSRRPSRQSRTSGVTRDRRSSSYASPATASHGTASGRRAGSTRHRLGRPDGASPGHRRHPMSRRHPCTRGARSMNLIQAFGIAAAPILDSSRSYEAMRVIGGHLAAGVDLAPDTVAVAVGRAALDLMAGATDVLGALPIFSVVGRTTAGCRPEVTFQWITGHPPADVPILVFDRAITFGAPLRSMLADLRHGAPPSITVLAVDATPEGVVALGGEHPDVEVIAPTRPEKR